MKVAIMSDKLSSQFKKDIMSQGIIDECISLVDYGDFDTLSTLQCNKAKAETIILKQLREYLNYARTQKIDSVVALTISGNSGQIYANKIEGCIAAPISSESSLEEAFVQKCNFYDIPTSLGIEAISNIINQIGKN